MTSQHIICLFVREWWYTLHLTTDVRYCLAELVPSTAPRVQQYPDWWLRGAGSPYPATGRPETMLYNSFDRDGGFSCLIIRDAQHHLNISGGKETYVPARLLKGALPDALLDAYYFWQDESYEPLHANFEGSDNGVYGYKKLRGYPIGDEEESMLIIEIKSTGSLHASNSSSETLIKNDPNTIQATGLPGRTVSVVRRPKALMRGEFELFSRVASRIESLNLLQRSKKNKETKKAVKEDAKKFKLDAQIEVDYQRNGNSSARNGDLLFKFVFLNQFDHYFDAQVSTTMPQSVE